MALTADGWLGYCCALVDDDEYDPISSMEYG
jgi:hypothetical protein